MDAMTDLTHFTLEYPSFAKTFRNLTINPEDVNMSTWKSRLMGGRDQAFRCVVDEREATAVKVVSVIPWNRGILSFQECAQSLRDSSNSND